MVSVCVSECVPRRAGVYPGWCPGVPRTAALSVYRQCQHPRGAEHRCTVLKQRLARLVTVTTLHTAALLLVSVHEHAECACCKGELPQIRALRMNAVVKPCWSVPERCPSVETPSDGTGRPCPAAGARGESAAVPLKFIFEVWGVVTRVILFPEPPQVTRERRNGG